MGLKKKEEGKTQKLHFRIFVESNHSFNFWEFSDCPKILKILLKVPHGIWTFLETFHEFWSFILKVYPILGLKFRYYFNLWELLSYPNFVKFLM